MLPEPKHSPTLLFQDCIRLSIPKPVSLDLPNPEVDIRMRWFEVFVAAVPVAAI